MLMEEKGIIQESARVRFTEFDKHSMIINMRIYVDTDDFNEYLEVVERINIATMKIVQHSGAHFNQGFNPEFM